MWCSLRLAPIIANVAWFLGSVTYHDAGSIISVVYSLYGKSCDNCCSDSLAESIDSREQGWATQSAPPVLLYYFILCLPVVHPG